MLRAYSDYLSLYFWAKCKYPLKIRQFQTLLLKARLEVVSLSPAGDEGKKKHVSFAERTLQTRVYGRRRRARALELVKLCSADGLLHHVIHIQLFKSTDEDI